MNDPIAPATTLPYVQRRLEEQREWHSREATRNKVCFYAAEIATLLAGAGVPIVAVAVANPLHARILSAVLGAVVLVAAGLAKLMKFQENWLQYRAVAEALAREREFYTAKTGDYALADDKREALLVDRVEALLTSTTMRFIATHRAESGEGKAADHGKGPAPATPKHAATH